MQGKSLRFRAVSGAQIQNIEALENGVKRFIGWRYQEVEKGVWGFVRQTEPDTVSWRPEYAQFVREGSLVCADKETAAICGVPFEPVASSAEDKTKGGK